MSFIHDESGATAIVVAVAMTLLMACCALAIDLGSAYIHTAEIQTAADAAAYAAGRLLPVQETDTQKISTIEQTAHEYVAKNGIDNYEINVDLLDPNEEGFFTTLDIRISKLYELYFAKIIGKDRITIAKDASITVKPISKMSGAAPIGIYKSQLLEAQTIGNDHHMVLKYGGGDGENGVYGFIVLDNSNGNATALLNWMMYGYDQKVQINQTFPNATGNKASVVKQGVSYRLSLCTHYQEYGGCSPERYDIYCPRILKCLVYENVDYRTVKVVGFVPILLEGSDDDGSIYGSVVHTVTAGDTDQSALDAGLYTTKLIK